MSSLPFLYARIQSFIHLCMWVLIYFINSFLVSIWYPSYFRNTYLNMYYIYIFKSLRYINIFTTPNPQVLSCIQPAISQYPALSPRNYPQNSQSTWVPQKKLRNGWVVQKHVLSLKNLENIFILGKILLQFLNLKIVVGSSNSSLKPCR